MKRSIDATATATATLISLPFTSERSYSATRYDRQSSSSGKKVSVPRLTNATAGGRHSSQQCEEVAASVQVEEMIRPRFRELVEGWYKDIEFCSLEKTQILHPNFLKIVGMGAPVVPLILAELTERPFVAWLAALEAVVGTDIASSAVSFRGAVDQWVKWGNSRK